MNSSLEAKQSTILIVDDMPENIDVLRGILKSQYKIKVATNGQKALQIVEGDNKPDLILLDVMMPDMDGYEVCQRIKNNKTISEIPIIFVTAKGEVEDESKGFDLGAVDYINKPVIASLVLRRVNTQINLYQQKQKVDHLLNQTNSSIKYASLIQHALVPDEQLLSHYFSDYFTIWQPKDIVGGDIFLLDESTDKNELLLFVIDCTGHGVPGAFVTMLVKALEEQILAQVFKNNETVQTNHILSLFNQRMKRLLKQEQGNLSHNVGFDGGLLYLNKTTRQIKYSGANTSLYMIKDQNIEVIKGNRHSIGYKQSDTAYQFSEHCVDIQEGMQLYMSTDGFLDQTGGEKSFSFGNKRFKNLLIENQTLSMREQKKQFLEQLANYQGNEERNDDITLIGLKF